MARATETAAKEAKAQLLKKEQEAAARKKHQKALKVAKDKKDKEAAARTKELEQEVANLQAQAAERQRFRDCYSSGRACKETEPRFHC